MLLQEHKGETDARLEQLSLSVQEGINSSGESLMHSLAPVAGLVVAQQSTADLKLHCSLKLLLIEWWNHVSFDYLFVSFGWNHIWGHVMHMQAKDGKDVGTKVSYIEIQQFISVLSVS